MSVDEQRPVLAGLAALVGVALAVGLVAALAVVAGAHVLGLGGGRADGGPGAAGATMYLPKPQKTQPASGPSITLGSAPTSSSASHSPRVRTHPRKQISLQAGEQTVAPMGRIDLSGTYPGGEGAVLNVEKFSNGSWQGFYSVSATVTNGTFSTYIQTGTPGVNRFRVVDSDTHIASNEIKVTIR
ncbi:hypothetical protein [Nocardioides cynanchi]|uniref:hypothetical protein n=1 Tax=Nocardioides cynanchi TaxID=2558918 RepID=UPI001245B4FC|nr:hypothetical protein [Nocardioides cynanchi]